MKVGKQRIEQGTCVKFVKKLIPDTYFSQKIVFGQLFAVRITNIGDLAAPVIEGKPANIR
jgi:hypothetical protein